MDLNKVMIIGNLTRDPELRTIPSGIAVAQFGIATNWVFTDRDGNRKEGVEFHNIVAWRRLAEICSQYLHKGSKVYIEGKLQTRSWDDPNGFKRYKTEIVMDNMIMLDATRGTATSVPASYPPPAQPTSAPAPAAPMSIPPSPEPAPAEPNPNNTRVDIGAVAQTQPQTQPAASSPQPAKPIAQAEDLPTIDISEEEIRETDIDKNEENEEVEVSVEDIPF